VADGSRHRGAPNWREFRMAAPGGTTCTSRCTRPSVRGLWDITVQGGERTLQCIVSWTGAPRWCVLYEQLLPEHNAESDAGRKGIAESIERMDAERPHVSRRSGTPRGVLAKDHAGDGARLE